MTTARPADEGVRVFASGVGFTEGPVWTSRGELVMVSMSRGVVYGFDLTDEAAAGNEPSVPNRTWETGGGPNGIAEGLGGTLWITQNGGLTMKSPSSRPAVAGLQRIDGDVVTDVLTRDCDAPNDIAFGPDGLIWFGDPTPPGHDTGRVRTYDPTTGELRTRIDGIAFPNGIAFGLDPSELYVAASRSDDIRRFRIRGNDVEDLGVWARLPGGSPDGIAFDAAGRLYVTAFLEGTVAVFDPSGRLERTISTGSASRPTSVCFAGEELQTLVVTAAKGGRVYVVEEEFRGQHPAPWIVSAP